ncbi:fimbrial usher family protein [Escherichia coli E482]|nr:fimbrial usher family protein [Escherichia coli E482]
MSGYTVKPPTGDTNEQTQFIDYFNLFYSKRGQEQISISQQLGNYGTTFFSASRQSYWNTSRSDQQISFGLNVPFGDITTSLNYSYSNNIWQNDRDHLLAFTLNVPGVVCGRGRNPTLRLWPAIFSGEIDVFPSERRNMGQEIGR